MKPSSEKVKIQAPLLAMIFIALAFVLGFFLPMPIPTTPILQTIGFALVVIGFLLGLTALMAFRRARTISSRPGLVTSGVYRVSRNPVALGFVLMLIGLPLNVGSYWGLGLMPGMIVAFNWFVIEPEERSLERRFGKEFGNYKSRVRRWL